MARKSSGSLFSMAIIAVGGYFLYENWPAVSAWIGSVAAPAAAPPAAVPASAGTIVSTASVAATSPAPAASGPPSLPPSPGTVIPTATMTPGASTPSYILMQPTPLVHVSPVQETIAAAPVKNTAAIQAQIKDLQDELHFETNANGYTNEDRQDLHQQIAALQAQL